MSIFDLEGIELSDLKDLGTSRACEICGQPSPNTAECDDCFVAGDDVFRRAVDR